MIKRGIKTLQLIKNYKALSQAKNDIARERALLFLKNLLKEEGGIFTKFLQYQGTKQDEINSILAKNPHELMGIPFKEIQEIVYREFPLLYDEIKNLNSEGLAASVGQVHFAHFKDQEIAIKIQYPNIKQTFKEQFKLLNLLPKAMNVSPMRKWGFDLDGLQQKMEELINLETDYLREARELKSWKELLKFHPHVSVPEVVEELSNARILTTTRIDGIHIQDISRVPSMTRKKYVENLVSAYLDLMLNHRVIQGDTNHGNFLFGEYDEKVTFIDLGQTVKLSESFIDAFHYLLQKKYRNDNEIHYLSLFNALGFDVNKLSPIEARLPLLVEILFEPFLVPFQYDLSTWDYKKRLDTLLGEEKWWFRSAGNTEFFLFMKSFMGLKNLLVKLWPKLYLKSLVSPYISKNKIELPLVDNLPEEKQYKATKVEVQLLEDGRQKVHLKLPLMAIFNLEEYFSESTAILISQKGHNLEQIVKDALYDGGMPKVFFHEMIGKKEIILTLK